MLKMSLVTGVFCVAAQAGFAACETADGGQNTLCFSDGAGLIFGEILDNVDTSNTGASVEIFGTLNATDKDAVRVLGNGSVVSVTGALASDQSGIVGTDDLEVRLTGTTSNVGRDFVSAVDADRARVSLDGEIIAGRRGIDLGRGASGDVSFLNNANLDARREAIFAGDSFTLNGDRQAGIIRSRTANAIDVQDDATLNLDTGIAIRSDAGQGISVRSGTISMADATVEGARAGIFVARDATSMLDVLMTDGATVRGAQGIVADGSDTQSQTVVLLGGALMGADGIAADLAGGDDIFEAFGTSSLWGDVRLGDGADTLRLDDQIDLSNTGFDGGAGDDRVSLFGVNFADISTDLAQNSLFTLGTDLFFKGARLTGFELFDFDDGAFAVADVRVALSQTTPVPIPASLALMLGALGGLGLLRRRKA